MSNTQLSLIFFVQMFLILVVCRAVGSFNRRFFGQPQVVGEIIAGVLLGPSLFGLFMPEWQQMLFPKESLKMLYVGAQLGVGLFMFLVGMEFRSEGFSKHARVASWVSTAGMVVPFLLAVPLAYWMLGVPGLFSDAAGYFEAFLFLGAAISITGFPVLARIIHDRGLMKTQLGTLILSAGAVGDAVAWCVLAVVLASFGEGPAIAVKAIAGGTFCVVFMLTVGRWLLAALGRAAERRGRVSHAMLGTVLALLMMCASVSDAIGLHAVFGGFLLGLAMPRGMLTRELRQTLEPLAVVFLLPMFFTYSGLNTQLSMVSGGLFMLITLMILFVSIVGKGVACWAAARLGGLDNRTALAVGSLMNARGLMELIIVNIGLQKGLIQPPLFCMLVIMAIVTTLMASPLFEWFYGQRARAEGRLEPMPLGE